MDPCYHCHGTGIVDNSTTSSGNRPPTSPAAKQSTRAGVKPGSESRGATSNKPQVSPKTTAKEKPDGLFALLAAVFAGIMGYTHFEQTQNSTESLLMGAVCFVAGYAGLFVLYYVVKLAIELLKVLFVVVFWGGVALVVGNLLGIQLAADIIDFLETLWRNISSTL
ncbi:hypothetical protein NF212_15040 [Parasalinivibrio latis]|uniref:hypothetical protein n=1 Tax=Parasalinivibrio latis TaxID=2952610 RepID=UPI0030DEC9CE